MTTFSDKLLAASEDESLSTEELRAWMRRAALRLEDLSPTGRAVEIEAELIDRLDSLAESSGIKGYRDAVVHARVKRFDLGIGSLTSRRGTHSEVLITEDALRWLMNAFRLNHRELEQLVTLTHIVHRGLRMPDIREPPEEAFQASLAQYRQCRNQRLKIPATPEFPEVPPLSGYPDDQ